VKRLKELSQCDVPEHDPNGPNQNSISFVNDWESRPNPRAAFALTSVWHDETTGEILDVDMEINDDPDLSPALGTLGICPREVVVGTRVLCSEPNLVDIQNVVTHEAGHFFGLGHSDVPQSAMRPQSETRDMSKRTLEPDDIEGICAIYPPGSLPEECDYTPRNSLSYECAVPASSSGCGCTAAGSRETGTPGSIAATLAGLVLLSFLLRRRSAGQG
jgi:hypothetical protein